MMTTLTTKQIRKINKIIEFVLDVNDIDSESSDPILKERIDRIINKVTKIIENEKEKRNIE